MTEFLVRRSGEGVRAGLFDLEADIMEVVWSQRWDEFCVGEVHERLQADREIAYTTVMTTVSRLYDKGILDRRKDGRRYAYRPLFTRESYLEALTRDILERLPEASHTAAIAYLVEHVEHVDIDQLDRLEALIAKRRAAIEDAE